MKYFFVCAAFVMAAVWPCAVRAEVTPKDVQTIVRTIGFLKNSTGSVMAIIYDPGDAASKEDAAEMEKLMRDKTGADLRPVLVPVSSLGGLQGAHYAFVTGGMRPHCRQISSALKSNRLLGITLDERCMEEDCCSVFIRSKDRVEIVVNKRMADAVNASFKPVFLMMVTVQ